MKCNQDLHSNPEARSFANKEILQKHTVNEIDLALHRWIVLSKWLVVLSVMNVLLCFLAILVADRDINGVVALIAYLVFFHAQTIVAFCLVIIYLKRRLPWDAAWIVFAVAVLLWAELHFFKSSFEAGIVNRKGDRFGGQKRESADEVPPG